MKVNLKKVILSNVGRLIIQSDQSTQHQSSDLDDIQTKSYLRSTCDGLNDCVPLSECLSIQYQAAKACYSGDRSMYCGISEYEPYVCLHKLISL